MEGPPPLGAAELHAWLRGAGAARDAATTAKLAQFLNLLVRWNRVHNLTGARGARELVQRHLVESLALEPWLAGERVADVGSGAGFPGLPLAIAVPQRHFTLIESRAKRAHFLRHAVASLALGNAAIAHSRAEDLRPVPPFDTVLARAVARPARLLAIAAALMAPGSLLLVLTSAELAGRFREAHGGFAVREVAAAAGLPSTIVALERTRAG